MLELLSTCADDLPHLADPLSPGNTFTGNMKALGSPQTIFEIWPILHIPPNGNRESKKLLTFESAPSLSIRA
ncbi:MAG: hypothetical protein ABSF82_00605 [Candidatus Bathyarchaeia archaeon]